MKQGKAEIIGLFNDFVELSFADYGVKQGGEKGNTTLRTYDGKQKVQKAVSEHIVFNERLQVAKQLIDECLHEWSEGSRDEIKALIGDAFQVDKEGNINTNRVLGLRRHNFKNTKWLKAMKAIEEAREVVSTSEFYRFYDSDDEGKYQAISLDFAKL